jgi:hypothetical protein
MHQLVLVLTPSLHAPAERQAANRSYNFTEALALFSAGALPHSKLQTAAQLQLHHDCYECY